MLNRDQTLAALSKEIDVIVIGGGINGAVSAAALAAHGVDVALVEANDFASMTSQESSNMVWGGIKYLQDYEFGLVWSLCRSRNELLAKYPNRVKQIPFFAVIGPTSPFGRALGYVGALIYWVMGRFKTDRPQVYSSQQISKLNPKINLRSTAGAIQYNDAILLDNDARFVYEFVKTAATYGAKTLNYFEINSAEHTASGWKLTGTDKQTGQSYSLTAKILINATGPKAKLISDQFAIPSQNKIVMSKGVHLIVPKIDTNGKVLAFFDETGRLFYVLPMQDRTVIGTTDTPADSNEVLVTAADRKFLLNQANRCLNLERALVESDIISERCGVRPLVVAQASNLDTVDWVSLSRKHIVEQNEELNSISIFGGKLTDCINVGLEVVEMVKKFGLKINKPKPWIGESNPAIPKEFVSKIKKYHPEDAIEVAQSLWRRQGDAAFQIIDRWQSNPLESKLVFAGLPITIGELRHIAKHEHVIKLEDLLRRRTPIALVRNKSEVETNQAIKDLTIGIS